MTPRPAHLPREAALEIVALAAALLFDNGQTTQQMVAAGERLGRALGTPVTLLPRWEEIAVQVADTPFSEIVRAKPLGVDMRKVMAVLTIIDDVCTGKLRGDAARAALEAVKHVPLASTPRFALFAAIGGAALGVIFGALDAASLLLIAFSAGAGGLLRRWLATTTGNPFAQTLCAAALAGAVGALAVSFRLSAAPSLVALCPCMVLVPGPHILNGALDLVRTRITLGIARLTYAALIVLMICVGLLLGFPPGLASFPAGALPPPVPLGPDVIAAGCAVSAYGTFFSIPWRLVPLPIAVGMLAHATRWVLISLAGLHVGAATLFACTLVGFIATPVAHRLRLPFAAFGFSAVVSMMPGFFLFGCATDLVALLSLGDRAPAELPAHIMANGTTAFLITLAMTIGLILPRMLIEHVLPPWVRGRRERSAQQRIADQPTGYDPADLL